MFNIQLIMYRKCVLPYWQRFISSWHWTQFLYRQGIKIIIEYLNMYSKISISNEENQRCIWFFPIIIFIIFLVFFFCRSWKMFGTKGKWPWMSINPRKNEQRPKQHFHREPPFFHTFSWLRLCVFNLIHFFLHFLLLSLHIAHINCSVFCWIF